MLVGHNDLCLLSCNYVNGTDYGSAGLITAEEYVANVRSGKVLVTRFVKLNCIHTVKVYYICKFVKT